MTQFSQFNFNMQSLSPYNKLYGNSVMMQNGVNVQNGKNNQGSEPNLSRNSNKCFDKNLDSGFFKNLPKDKIFMFFGAMMLTILLGAGIKKGCVKKLINQLKPKNPKPNDRGFRWASQNKKPAPPSFEPEQSGFKPLPKNQKPKPQNSPCINPVRISEGVVNEPFRQIQELLNHENISEQDLRQVETIFKNYTGISLYCPEPQDIRDFTGAFGPLINQDKYKNLSPEIKHIIIGHGIGGSVQGNWRFRGNKVNVFDFIEEHIPKGEKILLVTCETVQQQRPGLGGPVSISLYSPDRPAKVVESGIRRVIGSATLLRPGVIEYF